MPRHLPFYYGWVIVAVTFVCFAVGYTTYHSSSIFYVAILEEFGWSRAATAVTFSLWAIVYGLSSPLAGALVDRFGPRRVLPFGACVLGAGLLMTTRMSALWQFYLLFGVVAAAGLSSFATVPTLTVLNNWFVKKRGAAAGLATAGIGMGIFFFVPALQTIITASGWRTAYLVLAVATLVVVPALTLTFFRYRPQDLGLHPDGETPAKQPDRTRAERVLVDDLVVDKEWAAREWTLSSAARTRRFWLLLGGRFLETATIQLLLTHQAAYLVDANYDKQLVASIIGLLGVVSSCGKIIWGFASDRIGREMTYTLAYVSGTAAIVLLLSVHAGTPVWVLYGYAVFYGLSYGAAIVLLPALAADLFHGRRFGSVLGGLYAGAGFGQASGAFLGGIVYDLNGSYGSVFLLAIPAMWLSCLAYWLAAPRKVRLVAGRAPKRTALPAEA